MANTTIAVDGRQVAVATHGSSDLGGSTLIPRIFIDARRLVHQMGTHSISAGLDYAGVGPEHAYLKDAGLASYVSATDQQALAGLQAQARTEGILPALEPAHVIGWLLERPLPPCSMILVRLSGRGDKRGDRSCCT